MIFLMRQKYICFLKYIYYAYLFIHIYQSFSTILDKDLRRNIKKNNKEMEKSENINEIEAVTIK